jgi:Family of unknown function (DUF695)
VFRYAREFRDGFEKAAFPDRLMIVWQYTSDSGMPAPAERDAMDRMEDLLEPVVKKAGVGVLVLVSTGENLREWIFYATTEEAFIAALNQALADQPRFPIELHAGHDPNWSAYARFCEDVRA